MNGISEPMANHTPRSGELDTRTALFDGGNTRLHCGWWNGRELIGTEDMQYPVNPLELQKMIENWLKTSSFDKMAVCSVSPPWKEPLFRALSSVAGKKLMIVSHPSDIGMTVGYDRPETIGIDRVLAAFAAYRHFGRACVVVNAGTAVTIDAVDEGGVLCGGFIFPGLAALSSALTGKTALPSVVPFESMEGIGHSTEKCIAAAASQGLIGAVERLVDLAATEISGDTVAVTGGTGAFIARHLLRPSTLFDNLVLTGLGLVSNEMAALL